MPVRAAQFTAHHFGRLPDFAAGLRREPEQVRVELRPIDLKSREPGLITRADLNAIVEGLVGPIREPEPEPLFDQLLMSEIAR